MRPAPSTNPTCSSLYLHVLPAAAVLVTTGAGVVGVGTAVALAVVHEPGTLAA